MIIFGSAMKVVFVAAAAMIAWQFKPLRPIIKFFFGIIPAIILFLFGVFAVILWRPVGWLADRLADILPIERWAVDVLEWKVDRSYSLLVRDDRQEFSQKIWPRKDYPDLYQDVPEDIKRPPYEDGRLIGGIGITWLTDRYMTDMAFRSAVRGGFKAGLVVLVATMIFLILKVFGGIIAFLPALLEGQRPIIEQWPGAEPIKVSLWRLIAANFGSAFGNLIANLFFVFVQTLAAIPLSAGAGIIVTFLLLTSWMQAKSEPYRLVTKDADVRWAYRTETRLLLRETFRQQLKQATTYLKDAATYPIGIATGTLRARGDLAAPVPEQPLKLDQESLFQHLLVFGGTGEGKTTAVLKPLLRKVLANRQFGAFIADAKGVLWQDAQGVAEACGRGGDVIVIGTGAGQMGVNPIASLTPTQVAATLRSVLKQVSGEASDNFWPEMAANAIRHALTIGYAYAQIPSGQEEAQTQKINPYSLWWAYRALTIEGTEDNPGALALAIFRLREHQADETKAWRDVSGKDEDAASIISRRSAALFTPDLIASIQYLEGAWTAMAVQTKTGIIASVTQLLDGFSGSPVLRERFASGRSDNTVDLRSALDGKIVLNALSSIEDGLPARLTSILIKTALYREARVREAEWKREARGRKPQDKPCFVVMDEVQELATVDPASGLSDASFWNVARSTGLAGVFATQTVAALVQAIGKEATDNFMQQARSKVFLRSEERETIEYACWCAGEYERNRVYEDGHRESLEYRGLIDGWNPFAEIDQEEQIAAGPRAFFASAAGLINPQKIAVGRATAQATYNVDTRFVATDPTPGLGGGSSGNAASMGSLQAAHWRAEDLTRQYRMEGNDLAPALTPADMLHMGRWHAFAQIQRAGAVRQDIIRVEHDFD